MALSNTEEYFLKTSRNRKGEIVLESVIKSFTPLHHYNILFAFGSRLCSRIDYRIKRIVMNIPVTCQRKMIFFSTTSSSFFIRLYC